MKRISNWSIVGIAFGFLFSLTSGIRYFVLYPDEDKAIAYVIVGGLIMSVVWLYGKLQLLGNTVTAVEDYLAEKGRLR